MLKFSRQVVLLGGVLLLVALLTILAFSAETSNGLTYYIDNTGGNDSNDGLSQSAPWKSLEKFNATTFDPGDKILFKAGSQFTGQLVPKGSGKLEDGRPVPIVIDRYGEGEKPRIDAEGNFESALYVHNVEYWEINNLELTNKGPEPKSRRKGVYVHIEDYGTASHIHLKNLYIHDVNGSCRKRDGASGGIRWQTQGNYKRSRLNGFLVEDCHIVRCERDGIKGGGPYQRGENWFPSLNVVIRSNLIEQVPGDGIVPIACDGALVEHNVMRDCTRKLPQGDAAAGIWPWACDNTTIQFNEVSDHKAPWDAQGFDSDWDCRNTIIQYNYSHDNEGGFLLVCNNGGADPDVAINTGTVIRYNVSVNDGFRQQKANGRDFSPIFHISGPVKDTKIYNNVIYVEDRPDPDPTMIQMDNWGGPWPTDTWFANNIFYVKGKVDYDWGESRHHWFEHNVFFGEHSNRSYDPFAITSDPLFESPESVGEGFETLRGFMLSKESPCIQAGISISPNGGRDLFGNSLRGSVPPSIGVHEIGASGFGLGRPILHFAQFGDGPGLSSALTLVNPWKDFEVSGTVRLFDEQGEPLSININGSEQEGEFEFILAPGGVGFFESQGTGNTTVTGSVEVESDRTIGGSLLFAGEFGVSGVGAADLSNAFFVPIEIKKELGISTGIAVSNPSPVEAYLKLRLRDREGTLVPGTAELTLPSRSQKARFPGEIFPLSGQNFSSFEGTLEVESNIQVAAMAIRLSPGEYDCTAESILRRIFLDKKITAAHAG